MFGGMMLSAPGKAAMVTYHDETAFRAAAGPTTTYGFAVHGVTDKTALPSPGTASQLDVYADLLKLRW
jgi:hypothetical protein